MATGVEILTEARRLIAEVGWTQEFYARDAAGNKCYWGGSEARFFCADGAIMAASHALRAEQCAEDRAGFLIENVTPAVSIVSYNDAPGRTKDDVLAIFDKAIALGMAA